MGFERRDAVDRGAGKANGDFVEVMAVGVNEFDAGDALQRVDDRVECSGVSNREARTPSGPSSDMCIAPMSAMRVSLVQRFEVAR